MKDILSLFDGKSDARVALNRTDIRYGKYYASEIDKYAIKIASANYANTIQLGDILNWRDWGIDWSNIGLLIGGSPCQGFSFAGKQLAFDDPRSKLFFTYCDILNHIRKFNPDVKFLLENVRMKQVFQDVITDYLGVEPIPINSAVLSALNRPRLYWGNFLDDYTPPQPTGLTIGDIMLPVTDNRLYLSPVAVERLRKIRIRAEKKGYGYKPCILGPDDKFLNLDANFFKGPDGKRGVIDDNGELRMPSPEECELMQNLHIGYTMGVSKTQRYKMLGNGFTVNVIVYLLSYLKL